MNPARHAECKAVERAVLRDDLKRGDPGVSGLTASAGAGEWDQGDVSGTLDRDSERALMTGAGSELAAWLDLAALADMTPKARDVLVIDMIDVIDAERTNLASGSVAPTSRTSATCSASWPAAGSIALAPLALRSTESRAARSPRATASVTFASWTSRATETRSLGPTFT